MTRCTPAAIALALALAVPATAGAQQQNYPPPSNPGSVQHKPHGPFHTLHVSKHGKYKTIQAAVNRAKPGDTIKIAHGTYRESVSVKGSRKRFIKLVGDVKHPEKVVLDGQNKTSRQNGVIVTGADAVTIKGIKARRYKGNGFFVNNATGYAMDHLISELAGTYGIYAFNTKGGSMTNSLSYFNADGAYYIGQTPEQTKPLRTTVRNVVGWGSVIGYTGTNSRYVTISRSRFFNNAVGVAPNTLSSEKFPPNESNVFTNNDVFWNNFDVYKGKPPFKPRKQTAFIYPPGAGFFLLSGRDNLIQGNRIFGNALVGLGIAQNPFLDKKDLAATDLLRNRFVDNQFGSGGTDLNGHDAVYTTNGTGNCFSNNPGMTTNIPADPSFFPACPFAGADPQNGDGFNALASWAVGDSPKYREGWVLHPHGASPVKGIVPIDGPWQDGKTYGPKTL